ncbi:hypothetical protein ACP4OV_006056 [Aristida adscensionis]
MIRQNFYYKSKYYGAKFLPISPTGPTWEPGSKIRAERQDGNGASSPRRPPLAPPSSVARASDASTSRASDAAARASPATGRPSTAAAAAAWKPGSRFRSPEQAWGEEDLTGGEVGRPLTG